MLSNGVYLLLNKGDFTWFWQQKKTRKINRKVVMFESSKFDKSGLKSGGHIRPGPDLKKRPDSGRGRM